MVDGADILATLAARVPLPPPELPPGAAPLLPAFRQCWTPRPREDPAEWARRTLRLTEGQTPQHAGEPWDIARVPHVRLIFDFLADPWAEELSIQKSSAAALSTGTIVALVHMLHEDPANILYLISNKEEASKIAKGIWKPFLRQAFGTAVIDREDQSNLHLQVAGAQIFSGSPTESLLRNKQVRVLVEDEGDTMEDETRNGGSNLDVAERERTKNARRRKIIRLCTPLKAYDPAKSALVQPGTRINRHYQAGDRREFRCQCPSCAMETPILEADLHFPPSCQLLDGTFDLDAIEALTFWRCPFCRHEVRDRSRERADMIRAARWVPTVKAASRRFWSALYTDLTALIGGVSWGSIKAELVRTEGTAEHAAVRRSHLAEPEVVAGAEHGSREARHILRHCGTYERGTCPVIPWQVALVSDVQPDRDKERLLGGVHFRFPWMLGAIAREPAGGIFVIDWGEASEFDDLYLKDRTGKIHGLFARGIPFRARPESWAKFHPGRAMPATVFPKRGLIDSGFRARGKVENEDDAGEDSVYSFCLNTYSTSERRFRFIPVKGRAGRQIQGLTVESARPVRGVQLPLIHYDDWAFKSDMQLRLMSDPANPSPLAKNRPRIHFPQESDIDETFLNHLTAERIVEVPVKNRSGRPVMVRRWESSGANDWWDCLKWFLVLNEVLQRHAVTEAAGAA